MKPSDPAPAELTRILQRWSAGDPTALEEVAPILYEELRRIAMQRMRRQNDNHMLEPSALVHEVFIRLSEQSGVRWENRAHFFAYASTTMRNVLVDFARRRALPRADISSFSDLPGIGQQDVNFLDLDTALTELAALHARQASVVEMKFFGGVPVEEIAAVLGVSEATVHREWRTARAFLFQRLKTK